MYVSGIDLTSWPDPEPIAGFAPGTGLPPFSLPK